MHTEKCENYIFFTAVIVTCAYICEKRVFVVGFQARKFFFHIDSFGRFIKFMFVSMNRCISSVTGRLCVCTQLIIISITTDRLNNI